MGPGVINRRSALSVTGWSPARTPLDCGLVGEISMPRVSATETKEMWTRWRSRGAVEAGADTRCPAAGAWNEVRVSCISSPPTSVGSSYINGSPSGPMLSMSRARGLGFNETQARGGKTSAMPEVWASGRRITSLSGLGGARWSAPGVLSKLAAQDRTQAVRVASRPQGLRGGIRRPRCFPTQ
jgi:hypothetical protein